MPEGEGQDNEEGAGREDKASLCQNIVCCCWTVISNQGSGILGVGKCLRAQRRGGRRKLRSSCPRRDPAISPSNQKGLEGAADVWIRGKLQEGRRARWDNDASADSGVGGARPAGEALRFVAGGGGADGGWPQGRHGPGASRERSWSDFCFIFLSAG